MTSACSTSWPQASIEWDGVALGEPDLGPDSHSVALTVRVDQGALRFVFNAYWEPLEFALPVPDASTDGWRRLVDTSLESPDDIAFDWDEAPEVGGPTHRVEAAFRRRPGGAPGGGHALAREVEMMDAERKRMENAGHPENGWREASPWYRVGAVSRRAGVGRRSARTTPPTATRGARSRTTTPARGRTAGTRTGWRGLTDVFNRLSLALALWNGRDPILKERMFGLAGPEGNHGEDVKEYWWYLDALPSSAWLRWRYHYPQARVPVRRPGRGPTAARSKLEPEYELIDTGIFDDDRYWIVEVHYAKAIPTDVLMRITVRNRGPETATLHVLPTLWFRNDWSWNPARGKPGPSPPIRTGRRSRPSHADLGRLHARGRAGPDGPRRSCCSARTRPTRARIYGTRPPRRIRRTASTTTSSAGPRRSTRRAPARRPRPGTG